MEDPLASTSMDVDLGLTPADFLLPDMPEPVVAPEPDADAAGPSPRCPCALALAYTAPCPWPCELVRFGSAYISSPNPCP